VIIGSLLGIVFGASSMYLVLKVGLTVSASIPVSVLTFALFKVISKAFRTRSATVLENNISQTAGSAGESIAFAVGLVMPALLVLGFDIDVIRVMTVGVLGGLLGILMMIPLRRAFIVQKHGELKYPEGTACADVIKAGEKGGSTAALLVAGLAVGFVYQFFVAGFKFLKETASYSLGKLGFKGASIGSEMSAPLLGVGFIIGPRIASTMMAGGVLASLVISPMVAYFGAKNTDYILPAEKKIVVKVDEASALVTGVSAQVGATVEDGGFISNMADGDIRSNYVLYIGAGAVAAGGILSMLKALPTILMSVYSGLRDLFRKKSATTAQVLRTERDLPIWVVVFGSIGLVLALMLAKPLGLSFSWTGLIGALFILFFGFLFVTVSSRLTGEIGSSSNPISGMTVATLLLTCLLLIVLSQLGYIVLSKDIKLLALTVAGIVCVASSNGGTTSQALKTGHLLGATPLKQQYAIIIGSLTSAVAVGAVLLLLNESGTTYTTKELPANVRIDTSKLEKSDTVKSGNYVADQTSYKVLVIGLREKVNPELLKQGDVKELAPGRYLVEDGTGVIKYRCDPAVNGKLKVDDTGKAVEKYEAPKTELVAMIIDGILDQNLPWNLVIIGVMVAVVMELCGVPSLAFAVGVYLPLSSSTPIFLGGLVRWIVDKVRNQPSEGDSSPGVLLSSGYIAGGAIATLIVAGIKLWPAANDQLGEITKKVVGGEEATMNEPVMIAFGVLMLVLFGVGSFLCRKPR
jgi:OPT family oligopeptide transporter